MIESIKELVNIDRNDAVVMSLNAIEQSRLYQIISAMISEEDRRMSVAAILEALGLDDTHTNSVRSFLNHHRMFFVDVPVEGQNFKEWTLTDEAWECIQSHGLLIYLIVSLSKKIK